MRMANWSSTAKDLQDIQVGSEVEVYAETLGDQRIPKDYPLGFSGNPHSSPFISPRGFLWFPWQGIPGLLGKSRLIVSSLGIPGYPLDFSVRDNPRIP